MPLFDTYVMVDWSAKNRPTTVEPQKNAIWWAVHPRRDDTRSVLEAFRNDERSGGRCQVFSSEDGVEIYEQTRHAAIKNIQQFLLHETAGNRRVLIGFDFAFGYPMGFAEAIIGKPYALELWSAMSGSRNSDDKIVISDKEDNKNNRFTVAAEFNRKIIAKGNDQRISFGPFWGFPGGGERNECMPTKDPYRLRPRPKEERAEWPRLKWPAGFGFDRKRITDDMADGAKSVFQLTGAGSVGSQVLVGMPALHRLQCFLRDGKKSRCVVWPFETGFSPGKRETPEIVIVEIYPSLLREAIKKHRLNDKEHEDRAQVRLNALAFSLLGEKEGVLDELFRGPEATGTAGRLTSERKRELDRVRMEEGWILGVDCMEYHKHSMLCALKEHFLKREKRRLASGDE